MRRVAGLLLLALVAACTLSSPPVPPHKVVVFFQEWSAAIDPAASAAISAAAQWAQQHPDMPVIVTGVADPTGSAQANHYLSLTRAQVVADRLAADGVAPGRISIDALGASSYTLTSQESRRVEIAIGAR
jgi:outer membrane protein OmpA-like peptidoglycan-associated protein